MDTTLNLDQIRAALCDATVGHTVDYHRCVPSTMPLAHALAADPAVASGALVVAEEQSAGRGRRQRRWETPPGQALLVSLLLKAPLPIDPVQAPMAAGLALHHACVAWQPALAGCIGLKWPNDLLLGTAHTRGAKVAGVLVESSYRGSAVDHVVIGMGINVLQDVDELPPAAPGAPPPTSLSHFLRTQSGAPIVPPLDRTALLIALCRAWSDLLETAVAASTIWPRWRDALWTLGQPVTVYDPTGNALVQGTAVDVDPAGHLIVEDHSGQRHHCAAGDVSLRSGLS